MKSEQQSLRTIISRRLFRKMAGVTLFAIYLPYVGGYWAYRLFAQEALTSDMQIAFFLVGAFTHLAAAIALSTIFLCGFRIELIVTRPIIRITRFLRSRLESGSTRPLRVSTVVSEIGEFAEYVTMLVIRVNARIVGLCNESLSFAHDISKNIQRLKMGATELQHSDADRTGIAADIEENATAIAHALDRNLLLCDEASKLNGQPPAAVDIAEQIELCTQQSMHKARKKGITIDTSMADDPVEVFAHAQFIQTILHNLIDNAIKYTPPNGRIEIATSTVPGPPSGRGTHQATVPSLPSYPPRPKAELPKAGAMRGATGAVTASLPSTHRPIIPPLNTHHSSLILRIDDTGPGIPPADRERIFTRGYRCATALAADGQGYGLDIVKTLVEIYEGTVACDAAPSGGARFTITLPIDTKVSDK